MLPKEPVGVAPQSVPSAWATMYVSYPVVSLAPINPLAAPTAFTFEPLGHPVSGGPGGGFAAAGLMPAVSPPQYPRLCFVVCAP